MDVPAPRGQGVEVTMWLDTDHDGDLLTRRRRNGYIVFVNSALIIWYSKRQATIEFSKFGSEMVAIRTTLDIVKILLYKIQMVGVEEVGPSNYSMFKGAYIPNHKFLKKHLRVCCHVVYEASVSGICKVGFVKIKRILLTF